MVEMEFVSCEFVDLDFLKKVNLSFIEKFKNLGWIVVFDVSDEVYPQLVSLFHANFEKH